MVWQFQWMNTVEHRAWSHFSNIIDIKTYKDMLWDIDDQLYKEVIQLAMNPTGQVGGALVLNGVWSNSPINFLDSWSLTQLNYHKNKKELEFFLFSQHHDTYYRFSAELNKYY